MYQGAHLASVHSEDENKFIYDSYQAEAGDGDIWIGGIRKGDSYSWLDGTPWNYQNWSPGNPSSKAEKCSEIFALNYYPSKWNDDNCELAKNAFVCQLPFQPIPALTDLTLTGYKYKYYPWPAGSYQLIVEGKVL